VENSGKSIFYFVVATGMAKKCDLMLKFGRSLVEM